jgi:hypothetical protein
MKWHFSILVLLVLMFSACSDHKSSNLNSVLVDKVWMSSLNRTQYYFSSKDGKEYLWMTFERRDGDTYTPFSEAKGNPVSNPLEMTNERYREGWSASDYFRIIGDTLIFQDEDDANAENLSKFHIQLGADTTIGVFDYKTLKVTNFAGTRIWRTKK